MHSTIINVFFQFLKWLSFFSPLNCNIDILIMCGLERIPLSPQLLCNAWSKDMYTVYQVVIVGQFYLQFTW